MRHVERHNGTLRPEPGCTCGPCAVRRGRFELWALNAAVYHYTQFRRRSPLRRTRPAGCP